MGWGRWLFLGDLGQQLDLADQQAEIDRLKNELQTRQALPSSVEQRLESLQRDNDELKLYLAALVRLLLTKQLATVEEIRTLVTKIDQEDGREDKKHRGPVIPKA
jgi:hypothetical protein